MNVNSLAKRCTQVDTTDIEVRACHRRDIVRNLVLVDFPVHSGHIESGHHPAGIGRFLSMTKSMKSTRWSVNRSSMSLARVLRRQWVRTFIWWWRLSLSNARWRIITAGRRKVLVPLYISPKLSLALLAKKLNGRIVANRAC